MILVDANLLLYASIEEMRHHAEARRWLEAVLSDGPRVGMPWQSLLAFVRIATNPRLFDHPAPITQAWAVVRQWLDADPVWVPGPTVRHFEVLSRLVQVVDRSPLVMDAHLAAVAIEHGLTLCTTDRDFSRFPGLRWRNPLDV